MADFSKLGKGITSVLVKANEAANMAKAKRGMQDVLPAAEREANFAKFLEGSKVKGRLYHGTTAHDDYADESGQAFNQFAGRPTWLAKEPYTASGYSGGTGSTYAVHAQVKNPLALKFDANDEASKAFPIAKRFGVDIDHMTSMRKPERAWEVINDPAFVDAVQAAGHDGLIINEGGYKTFGVFDPNKIKSATGNRGTYDINEADITKAKGGVLHMASAGKVIKGGLNAIRNASKAADQALEAKRLALEAANPPIKASEAYGQHEGSYLKPIFYDRMKVDLSKGKKGGPGFSGIQLVDPDYALAKAAAGVTDQKMATRILNRNEAQVPKGASVIWTPSVGSLEQHKSNSTLFGEFSDIFAKQRKNMSNDEIQKLSDYASTKVDNQGKLIFPNGIDLGARDFRQQVKTYSQRGLMADIFAGRGVGGEKGRTVPVEELLHKNLDPNVADAGTLDLGNRLFRLEGNVIDRPDLHSDYRKILTGEDLNVNYLPVPIRDVYSDWEVQKALELIAQGKNRPVTQMDYTKNDPTVQLTEELLTKMQKAGQKKGGVVKSQESQEDMALFHKLFAMHKASGGVVAINDRVHDILKAPSIQMVDGGKVVKGLMGAFNKAEKAADAAMAARKVEAPSIIIPSKVSNVKEAVRQSKGDYGARRVERAADEIPNLERLYKEQALREAFDGDNAKALMTMNPADFEKFAMGLITRTVTEPKSFGDKTRMSTEDYLKYLRTLPEGFGDVPFLDINKQKQGLPLMPFISGHEGRHRNRAMAESGEQSGLVRLFPRAELREGFPRRSQEEYIEALKRELEMTGNRVSPESNRYNPTEVQRPAIELPDIYTEGGAVHMVDGGKIAKGIVGALTKASKMADAAMDARKAPQEDALRLAQQRAALPKEQNGLGLPVNNTAMDRAKALGYPMGKGFDVSYEKNHSPIKITNTQSKPTSPRKKAEVIKAELEQMGIPVTGETAATGSTYLNIPGKPYDVSPEYGGGQSVPIETLRFSTHSKKSNGQFTNEPDNSFITDVFPKGGDTLDDARKAIDDLIKEGGMRSRNAAFDPFRRNAAIAAAMGVLAPDLMAEEQKKATGGRVQESPEDMARFHKLFAMHKANGGAIKKPQKFDGGGIAVQEESPTPSEDDITKAGYMAELLAKAAKDQGKKEVSSLSKPRAVTDLINRGVLANNPLSAVVDMVNMGLIPLDILGTALTGRDIKVSSDKPFLGSEYVKDLMKKYNVTSDEERPMMETALSFASPTGMIKGALKAADLAKKAPEALNTVRGGLETASADIQNPFRSATLTMEGVAPDLGQKGGEKFKDLVTKRMISGEGAPVSMERMGGRKTEQTMGQGLYENFAKQLETNPMVGVTIPRAGNLSTNKQLIADIGTAGRELGQEMVAAHKFTPLLFKNPKDATAMMIGGSEPLTKKQILKISKSLPGMIVTHSPKNNSMFVAPFKGDALDYKKAAQAANEILGKGAKVQFGKADSTKDIMYRGDYDKMEARPPSAESIEMRNRLKKAEERIVRGQSGSQSQRQSQPSTLTSTVR